MSVDEIKAAIDELPESDYARLRKWFSEKDWQKWDSEFKDDSESGKLDFLIKEVFDEKEKGRLKEL